MTLGHSPTPDCRDTFLFRGVSLTLGETILLRSGTLAATTKGEGHGEWSREDVEVVWKLTILFLISIAQAQPWKKRNLGETETVSSDLKHYLLAERRVYKKSGSR